MNQNILSHQVIGRIKEEVFFKNVVLRHAVTDQREVYDNGLCIYNTYWHQDEVGVGDVGLRQYLIKEAIG